MVPPQPRHEVWTFPATKMARGNKMNMVPMTVAYRGLMGTLERARETTPRPTNPRTIPSKIGTATLEAKSDGFTS